MQSLHSTIFPSGIFTVVLEKGIEVFGVSGALGRKTGNGFFQCARFSAPGKKRMPRNAPPSSSADVVDIDTLWCPEHDWIQQFDQLLLSKDRRVAQRRQSRSLRGRSKGAQHQLTAAGLDYTFLDCDISRLSSSFSGNRPPVDNIAKKN